MDKKGITLDPGYIYPENAYAGTQRVQVTLWVFLLVLDGAAHLP